MYQANEGQFYTAERLNIDYSWGSATAYTYAICELLIKSGCLRPYSHPQSR